MSGNIDRQLFRRADFFRNLFDAILLSLCVVANESRTHDLNVASLSILGRLRTP
jgi:hypothetical protein